MSNEQNQTAEGGPLQRRVSRLSRWWRAYKHRREWTPERQLEHLRQMVMADHRWLAHDKTADALTTRYLAALAPDWMSVAHTDAAHFRREIGLEPQHAFSAFGGPEHMKRLEAWVRGAPPYNHGPLPEHGWD